MNRIRVFVGLDYHPSAVQVCVMDPSGKVLHNASHSNNSKKIVAAAERQGQVAGVAIEACTGAADLERVGYCRGCGWHRQRFASCAG